MLASFIVGQNGPDFIYLSSKRALHIVYSHTSICSFSAIAYSGKQVSTYVVSLRISFGRAVYVWVNMAGFLIFFTMRFPA